ncbi:DoxX family protein [Chitinophaga solisilvae]|uniref:DoxX family protein n=1 Tax=Chitinophaga solisilvae TaxID=1233460 RepID=UPI00136B04F2|nr:DoxX family protein [Chitinophaga solisilvae]
MQKDKIIYWIATLAIAAISAGGGLGLITSPFMISTLDQMGYPAYFRIELAICKIIGGIVLLVPVAVTIKEWAYAGLAINIISAIIAFAAIGAGASSYGWPVVALGLLGVSYVYLHRWKPGNAR